MHELALARSIVDIVQALPEVIGGARVKRVHVAIGALALVEPEALLFGFEVVRQGTASASATLEIQRVTGKAQCMGCGREATLDRRGEACVGCGSYQLLVTAGDDLRVTELEVE